MSEQEFKWHAWYENQIFNLANWKLDFSTENCVVLRGLKIFTLKPIPINFFHNQLKSKSISTIAPYMIIENSHGEKTDWQKN